VVPVIRPRPHQNLRLCLFARALRLLFVGPIFTRQFLSKNNRKIFARPSQQRKTKDPQTYYTIDGNNYQTSGRMRDMSTSRITHTPRMQTETAWPANVCFFFCLFLFFFPLFGPVCSPADRNSTWPAANRFNLHCEMQMHWSERNPTVRSAFGQLLLPFYFVAFVRFLSCKWNLTFLRTIHPVRGSTG